MIVVAALSAGATSKVVGPGVVFGVAAVVAAPFTDPTVLVAVFGTIGVMFTAWVNARSSRNKSTLDALRADMAEARERADEAAELVHQLDRQLHEVRVQLTRYEIGTLRLIDQLTHHGVAPVWHPETPERMV